MRERIEFEPAYLLAQHPYRETSQLLEAFTVHHGRVGLVARGARGPRSRLRGVLQPFAPLLLSWVEAGELCTLVAAESGGVAAALAGERVFHGWYLGELLLKLTGRHDPHPRLFHAYAAALAELGGERGEAALRIFEKRLLAETGYALPLTAALQPDRRYHFDPEQGPLEIAGEDAGYAGSSLIALHHERLNTREALRDARKLLQSALQRQLGGRELKVPQALRKIRMLHPSVSTGHPCPDSPKKPDT